MTEVYNSEKHSTRSVEKKVKTIHDKSLFTLIYLLSF